MNLLRESSLLRLWRRLAVGRRRTVQPVYRITVPAPLGDTGPSGQPRQVVVAQPAPLPCVVNG